MENTPKKRCPMRITTRRGSERLILFCGYRNGTGSSQPNARETEVRTTSALAPVFRPVNFDIRPETRIVKQEASVPCHGSACPCGSTSSFPGLFYSVALDLIGGGLMASFGRRLNLLAEFAKLAVGSPSEMIRYHRYHPDPARFRPIPR
jgi:hypothetical protein